MRRAARRGWALALGCAALGTACAEGPAGGRETDPHSEERHGEETASVVELSAEAAERIGLRTATAALGSLADGIVTTGEVGFDERRLAHVAPRLPGRVLRVEAELGDRVAAGEVLAVVDSVELGGAKRDYLRARAHHEVALARFEREQSLFADRIISEQAMLDAEAEAREEAAELAAAEETLRLYGLSPEEVAALDFGDPRPSLVAVRAPFTGKVVAKEVARGELVTPERTLFTVADLERVWIWIDLYERDLARASVGDAVEVRFDAYPGELFAGRLSYLGDEVEPESRTLRARVDLANPDGELRPGMFARVRLRPEGGSGEGSGGEAPVVPEEALQRRAEGFVVFVALGEHRFERRAVEPGRRAAGLVEILAGLEAGEAVVTRGAFLLKSEAARDELGGHHH